MPHSEVSTINADLDSLLKEAIVLAGAVKGLIQFYDEKTDTLSILSSYQLGEQFLTTFKAVKAFDPTACGRCFGLKIPIIIDDVMLDSSFFPFRQIIELEEIRSAKSVPLYYFNERSIIGVLSTYFPKQLHMMHNALEIPASHKAKIAHLLYGIRNE